MSLEYDGYTHAEYKNKIYRIYSEPCFETFTIKLIKYSLPFIVNLCDIELIKLKENVFRI